MPAAVCLLLLQVGANSLPAQIGVGGSAVAGTVFDSIGAALLRGAAVQLVGAADPVLGRRFSARTDSLGRYTIAAIPPGRYLAGFHHPRLDSLGLESEERAIAVGNGTLQLDLATPSPATFIGLVCPDQPGGALLVGHVRTTGSQEALAGATIAATWSELDTASVVVRPRTRERAIPASPSGWFALCGLPNDAPVLVRAAAGADTSGYMRLSPEARAVRVATFHVGGAVRAEATEPGSAPAWSGSAELTGIVRDGSGQPIANAQLSVWGTNAGATTDARGRFQLGDLPGGTQTVEVRAIGYRLVEQVVTLSPDVPGTAEVRLEHRVTELAGVNVTASPSRGLKLNQFYERMRDAERGINRGYFITPEDMERRKPAFVTQMFHNLPGVRVFGPRSPLDDEVQGLRRCLMTVYLDNVRIVGTLNNRDDRINRLVPPGHVAAIEVYPNAVNAPPQYQPLNGSCGIILIWTK